MVDTVRPSGVGWGGPVWVDGVRVRGPAVSYLSRSTALRPPRACISFPGEVVGQGIRRRRRMGNAVPSAASVRRKVHKPDHQGPTEDLGTRAACNHRHTARQVPPVVGRIWDRIDSLEPNSVLLHVLASDAHAI